MDNDYATSSGDPRPLLEKALKEFYQTKELLHSEGKRIQEAEFRTDSTIDHLHHQIKLLDQGASPSESFYSSAAAITMSGTSICAEAKNIHDSYFLSLDSLNQKVQDSQALAYANTKSLIFSSTPEIEPEKISSPETHFDLGVLIRRVKTIAPDLATKIEGCFAAINSENPDNLSQAYHSMREAVTHLIEILAPDVEVKKADWFVTDKTSTSGVTRAQRLKFAILGRKALSEAVDPVASEVVRKTLEQYREVIGGDHKRWHGSANAVKEDLLQFAAALNRFLEVRETNLDH